MSLDGEHSFNIWIVDFGSQYTQLITRKSRELGYSSFIMTPEEVRSKLGINQRPSALVLSGGPQSIFEDQSDYSYLFANKDLPVLGICYGMQIMAQHFGGKVERGTLGEYGHTLIGQDEDLFLEIKNDFQAWMSHSDHVVDLPEGFNQILSSKNGVIAGIQKDSLLGLQFHPEVEHTEHGKTVLKYFFENVAKLEKDWTEQDMLNDCMLEVENVGKKNVLCAFSGGVDSLVAATLASRVLGDQLHCFFIDNGLLRDQDYNHIDLLKKETGLNIEIVDAKNDFYSQLSGVSDPEKKRKVIGKVFIDVFEKKVHEYERDHQINFEYLLQGTLYPDVIESISPHKKDGKSVTIKSHHNVGGLPEKMKLKLLEPLKYLFKDEVRALGEKLDLAHDWVYRHPFPGPGLGVRILGEVTPQKAQIARQADQILFEELHNFHLYEATWQAFAVLLPVKTVGVKGDARAYEEVICLRIVNSTDGMTCTWSQVPFDFLAFVSNRITNEVSGITRVVYDITSKPPGTIEWE